MSPSDRVKDSTGKEEREIWSKDSHGCELEGPVNYKGSGQVTHEMVKHFPVMMYPGDGDDKAALDKMGVKDLKEHMPDNVLLGECYLLVVLRIFSKVERRRKFPGDFDAEGDIRQTRLRFGPPPQILLGGRVFLVVYRGYYCLQGTAIGEDCEPKPGRGLVKKTQGVVLPDLTFGPIQAIGAAANMLTPIVIERSGEEEGFVTHTPPPVDQFTWATTRNKEKWADFYAVESEKWEFENKWALSREAAARVPDPPKGAKGQRKVAKKQAAPISKPKAQKAETVSTSAEGLVTKPALKPGNKRQTAKHGEQKTPVRTPPGDEATFPGMEWEKEVQAVLANQKAFRHSIESLDRQITGLYRLRDQLILTQPGRVFMDTLQARCAPQGDYTEEALEGLKELERRLNLFPEDELMGNHDLESQEGTPDDHCLVMTHKRLRQYVRVPVGADDTAVDTEKTAGRILDADGQPWTTKVPVRLERGVAGEGLGRIIWPNKTEEGFDEEDAAMLRDSGQHWNEAGQEYSEKDIGAVLESVDLTTGRHILVHKLKTTRDDQEREREYKSRYGPFYTKEGDPWSPEPDRVYIIPCNPGKLSCREFFKSKMDSDGQPVEDKADDVLEDGTWVTMQGDPNPEWLRKKREEEERNQARREMERSGVLRFGGSFGAGPQAKKARFR